jgi:hypothetical protein
MEVIFPMSRQTAVADSAQAATAFLSVAGLYLVERIASEMHQSSFDSYGLSEHTFAGFCSGWRSAGSKRGA